MTNKAIWKNWQYHLKLSYLYQRLIQNRNVWNDTRTCIRCTATEQHASRVGLLAVASYVTRSGELKASKHCSLLHIICRGEWMASKHCSLSRCSSPWRADYSPWRIVTGFCREVRFFTPKTQFSSNPIPNLIGNSTCDDSITWTSIIHNSMDFLHH